MARDRLIARRKALGFTQQSLAHEIGSDRNTVARWERGETEVSAYHRGPLATALQWTMTELDTALNGSALPRAGDGWYSNFVTLEQSATMVRTWEPMLVPGLLQTRAYAATLLSGNHDLVLRRMDRQRMITRPTNPVELTAVIDESVLRRPIGGPVALSHQLDHLATMAERPNVTVQVLPLDAPVQAVAIGSRGALVILSFPWPGGLVHLEHTGGARSLDSEHELAAHLQAFDQLRELALSPTESVERIRSAAEETTP